MTKVVVLSPDADEDLDEVREDCVYVIGGLVDRTVKKMESRSQAEQRGAQCFRRIPIKSHGPPGLHPVLNIDVVVRILVERMRRDDWHDILLDCLPHRHQAGPTSRELRLKRMKERARARQSGEGDSKDEQMDEDESTEGESS